jgi:uncharacterized membrane protein YraQ (UPF0718 family)
MAPWLLFGFLAAGILHVAAQGRFIERQLGGRGLWPILKATLFGIPLPLCSCGVIPVASSLRRNGASRGAAAAFLLATPQTGVDSIAVTWSLLGPVLAFFRVAAAMVSGVMSGFAVNLLKDGADAPAPSPAQQDALTSNSCAESCHENEEKGGALRRMVVFAFVTLPRDIGPSLLVGLLLAGLIEALVPPELFHGLFGQGVAGRISMMASMLALGIPLYVCATSSVPVAAALVASGISPGAALVFLMTGPASNMASITTSLRIFGRRATIVYLGTLIVTSLTAGFLLDGLFPSLTFATRATSSVESAAWWNHVAGAALLALLAAVLLPGAVARWRRRKGSCPEVSCDH